VDDLPSLSKRTEPRALFLLRAALRVLSRFARAALDMPGAALNFKRYALAARRMGAPAEFRRRAQRTPIQGGGARNVARRRAFP